MAPRQLCRCRHQLTLLLSTDWQHLSAAVSTARVESLRQGKHVRSAIAMRE